MKLKTLIVDDDMPTVELIRSSVDWRRLGIGAVYTAYNITQAKKQLIETGADIVISDIEMPRGSGLELLEWVREQKLDTEFLLLTCHERFDYAVNAVKLRAAEFLLKPFDVEVMEAALRRLADERRRGAGETVAEPAAEPPDEGDRTPALELEKLEALLDGRNKMELMNYVRGCIAARGGVEFRKLQHEIMQAVYTYLGKRDLSVAWLFANEYLVQLSERAGASATDLLRWFNFLLEYTFAYEEEMRRRYRLSERVDAYIREHYAEDIGRNEIAAAFFMSPEYLAKTYKKQTGLNLNDAIAHCRIEQAKRLLDRGERVSDATMAVGFNNLGYFSTSFKKYTGMTPVQYKNHG